jgi:hypothetical protein
MLELDEALLTIRLEWHDGDAKLFGEQGRIEADALIFCDIDHVQSEDDGEAELDELEGEHEVSFQRRGIDDIDDELRSGNFGVLFAENARRDLLIGGIGIEAIAAGKIDDADFLAMGGEALADFFFDSDTGVIANFLIRSGESIKEGRFAGIRLTGKSHSYQRRGHGIREIQALVSPMIW